MGRYVFVVHSEPVEGRDREYNQWYDEIHLKDVCAFPGSETFEFPCPGH